MKFFKHFVDAHRGQSLQKIRRRYGFDGIGRYWTLVELCAEKLEKNSDEEYSALHFRFTFDGPSLAQSLGYANLKQCLCYLEALSELSLCSIDADPETIVCSMPNLLESMDRDSKRARKARAGSAPKKKNKDKEEEKEKDKDSAEHLAEILPIEIQPKPSRPRAVINRTELDILIAEWANTLKHFKINLSANLDEVTLLRMLQRSDMGLEKTRLALIGMRFEESTQSFTPSKNVSLTRLLKPAMFEKFVKLGARDPVSGERPKGDYSHLEGV